MLGFKYKFNQYVIKSLQFKISHVNNENSCLLIQFHFFNYRKSSGGAILDPDDKIQDVLDDNDFVSIRNSFSILKVENH